MITSVYISNERIQVLSGVSNSSKKHVDIKSCIYISLPDNSILNGVITNEIAVKEALEKLWGKYDLPKKDVYLVIDSGTILNKKVKVPALPKSTVQTLVQEEFKDIEGFSNFLFDYTVLEDGRNGSPEVLCNAVGKELVASYIRIFDSVGINLKSIDVSTSCEYKLFKLNSNMVTKDCIVIVLDKNNMTSILHIDGTYSFSSRCRLLDERGTEQSKIEIARNMSSLIQFARSENSRKNLTDIFISGLSENEDTLCEGLSNIIGANVSIIPTCPEITYKGSEETAKFLLSDYLYAVGNLIRL